MKKKIGETSYKETSLGIIPRSKLVPLEIEGIKRAWDFVLSQWKTGKISITSDLIKEAHKVGFGWIFSEMGGKYRKSEVRVSKHIPPRFFLVPQLMSDFISDLNARIKHLPNISDENFIDELVSLLAWAHHKLLWIHPFRDYNGRVARLLNNIILLSLNLPPIELKVETKTGRKRYINALQKADSGVYKDLEGVIRAAIEETIKEI